MRLRAVLAASGIKGWQIQVEELPGRPDFAFHKKKLAVFVDGCFWHGCPNCYRRPKSKKGYWDSKVERNKIRDRKNKRTLNRIGWKALRFWEHEVLESPSLCARKLTQVLKAN